MYHPTRGGVRGGRDQFKWEDVKVDKHRENYLGHSIMAPVGRWQKGKDLHWYTRDRQSQRDIDAAKEEIKRIKEEEEQAMQEALGLAPKRSGKSHRNQLDKHEFQELVKRSSTAEDLGGGHAEAARVQGLGFSREPRAWEESSSLPTSLKNSLPEKDTPNPVYDKKNEAESDNDDDSKQKRRREEKEHVKHEKQHKKHEKRHSRDSDEREKRRSCDSDERKKHRHVKEKRRRRESASD